MKKYYTYILDNRYINKNLKITYYTEIIGFFLSDSDVLEYEKLGVPVFQTFKEAVEGLQEAVDKQQVRLSKVLEGLR